MKMLLVFAMFILTATGCFTLGLYAASAIDAAMSESQCESTERINELQSKTIASMKEHLRILGATGY